jgi:hypothetical protein
MALETLTEAVERLARAGYTASFRPEGGALRAGGAGAHAPEAIDVEEVVRFEGESDPGDEAILFALRCRDDGVRGTWAVGYGPGTPAADAELVRRLSLAGRRVRRGGYVRPRARTSASSQGTLR